MLWSARFDSSLLLVSLSVLTLAWLGLWLWARGPAELVWGT